VRKVSSIEIAGPARRRYNNTLRALASLPVNVRPA
jgi:4-methoxybenzoate monooxygenase (O-demethylating)